MTKAGKLLGPEGCRHEARAPARIHSQTRTPWAEPAPVRKETWPARHARAKIAAARPLPLARPFSNEQREHAPSHAGGHAGCAVRMRFRKARRHIREPSFVTHRQRTPTASRTARIRTTCRSKSQRTYLALTMRRGAVPGRSGVAGSVISRGAKPRAAGSARRAFPLEASEARSAAGAKA